MPRPRKPTNVTRTVTITARITPKASEKLDDIAGAMGLDRSDIVWLLINSLDSCKWSTTMDPSKFQWDSEAK